MILQLKELATLTSGVYIKPDITPELLYLQAVHFNSFGQLDKLLKPQIKLNGKSEKHLLHDGDVLFAAKGTHNFGVVYREKFGKAVASSSFIVIRLHQDVIKELQPAYLAWFLSNTPDIIMLHQKQLGTTIPSISIKKLAELKITIPTVERQELIIRLDKLRKRERFLTQQIDEFKEIEMKKRLINALYN